MREWFLGKSSGEVELTRLGYPGDALWIDEFDQYSGPTRADLTLGDGRRWAEMRNYWFFTIAKALVREGWDRDVGPAKRPFVG